MIIIMIITILIIALPLMPLFNGPVSLFGGIYSVKVICFLDLREKTMRQAVGDLQTFSLLELQVISVFWAKRSSALLSERTSSSN